MSAFCRREGLKEPTCYSWRGTLDWADHAKTAFLPVHVVLDEVQALAARGIEVALANGRYVRVQPGFDPDTLEYQSE